MIFKEATDEDNDALQNAITDYNIQVIPSLPRAEIKKINLVIKEESGNLIAGVNAEWVNWGILHIPLLFVFERYRGLGLGSKLLKSVEDRAREKGCYLAHLDTFEFQGKDFYLKNGYEIFGILDDCPKGFKRYYFKKAL
jgi:GNAT superfamily N-acetyltransferase